jgi:hypothetical protein
MVRRVTSLRHSHISIRCIPIMLVNSHEDRFMYSSGCYKTSRSPLFDQKLAPYRLFGAFQRFVVWNSSRCCISLIQEGKCLHRSDQSDGGQEPVPDADCCSPNWATCLQSGRNLLNREKAEFCCRRNRCAPGAVAGERGDRLRIK